ncbi:right-handed parallel beta-helix repeat-containing protein [Chitinophaga arvensicola]|uniref:Right handed beta helix region n=1 Tax=Chitinophaga arvensicola TaxID=29529 RepID=A0A1I0QXP5_9BACT|nr:right-handed parallel beta-helix repeat-containing protein [Chitinophaga arvensicola]SEW31799.1 Right handed beta helix region [Chitinophaga arvensicola]
MKKLLSFLYCCLLTWCCLSATAQSKPFSHPGMNQSRADLDYMKQQVRSGAEPWKSAFERLKAATDLQYNIQAYTHVLRGPFGKPNIGGGELSKGADLAYDCAVLWYITGEQVYADKAIAIINTWSAQLWDFDYNDAKLLAAWTGHVFCNAAEIIRCTPAGWKQPDVERFTHMLMTVYYPLMRYYFPQANGNWDGAIIHSIIAIAVFTDNREMFNNAVDHFLHAPVNGSLFKYIYPNGQCQESRRDQGHVQLGLGEFAGAAQIAYTQGTDLFSIANNRIALGYEYTAGYLLGDTPYCYGGEISTRVMGLRDDYEYVYRHYAAQGIYLPKTTRAADSVRGKATRSILTSMRLPAKGITTAGTRNGKLLNKKDGGNISAAASTPMPDTTAYIAGAGAPVKQAIPADAIYVLPGASLQDALNTAAGSSRWVVAAKGIHTLPASLKMPSGVTLAGEGLGTVLFLDPASGARDAIVNAADDLHDVTIRDLVLEGALKTDPGTDPNSNRSFRAAANRGGIIFLAQQAGGIKRLQFIRVTVQGCTFNGLQLAGANDVTIERCDFNENGSSVIPGPRLQHNVLLTHCSDVRIRNSRLDTSPFGSGIALSECRNVKIAGNEIARNAWYGVTIAGSEKVSIHDNFVEANDRGGLLLEYLQTGNKDVDIRRNRVHYNAGLGVTAYGMINSVVTQNIYVGNGNATQQELISAARKVIME